MTAAPVIPTPQSARLSRPPRAAVPPLPEFEKLEQAHRSAIEMLDAIDRLITHLDNQGLDAVARSSAMDILAYFDGPGRDHHAQEESQVFPGLLNSGDAELVQHVRRLQQDHGWLEEDWRELKPQIDGIANGYNWYDLEMLRHALPVFTALYQEHISLEENVVYPAARRHREALQAGEAKRNA